MKFYILTILCFVSLISSFVFSLFHGAVLPRKWGDCCYSKSKFARLYNRFLPFKIFDLDVFYEVEIIVHFILFVASLIIFIIDIFLNYAITNYLGEFTLLVISCCIIILPLLYDFFLTILWSSVDDIDFEK